MSSEHASESERLPSIVDPSPAPTGVASPGTPVYGAEDFDEADPKANLRRYLAAIFRYKWLILALVIGGTAAGYGVSRFIPLEYSAQVTIWVEVSQRGSAAQGPIQSGQLLQSYAWLDLLKSYTVLDPVVKEQRLYLRYDEPRDSVVFAGFDLSDRFRPGEYRLSRSEDGRTVRLEAGTGEEIESAEPGDSLGQALGFAWAPNPASVAGGQTISFTVHNPRDVARRLGDDIHTRMVSENANFLRLELTGTSPRRITSTLNAVAERYVDVAADLKSMKLNELAEILNEQMSSAEENLRTAEIELESFRVKTITLPTERATPVAPGLAETRDPVFDNYFSMKVEQEQLRRDREAIESALNEARDSSLVVESLEYIGSVRESTELSAALQSLTQMRAELRSLRSQYTDEYPPVRRLLDDIGQLESRTIPGLAWDLTEQIATREARIEGMVHSASGELEEIPSRQLEEARLTRRVSIAEDLYTTLRQRYETAKLAAASSIPDIRVLELAVVPEQPVGDDRPRIILMAFAGSFGLALLGAILLDRMDPRFRYPEQVSRGMRLAILGAIPHIKGRNGRFTSAGTAQAVEAFRELRLNVAHAYGAAGPLITAITSSGSGDGKSFISANLALSFADQGHRTLLIDGDLRRGTQHRLFGSSRKPGLTDLLAGDVNLNDVIRETSNSMLHIVGSGTRMQQAPELLGSPAMAHVLRDLRSRYGVILIDSPPLGAGVDPFIIGTLTGNLILVFRTGYTDREFAEAKLDALDRMPVRILGAILNAVPPHGAYRYYSYLPGYDSHEEGEGRVVKQLPGF